MARTDRTRLAAAPDADVVRLRCGVGLAANPGLAVDAEKGVIRNARVISIGPTVGHDFHVDEVMARQVLDAINAMPKGAKCCFTHGDDGMAALMGGQTDCIETLVGRIRNAHPDDAGCLADIHFGTYAAFTPKGDLRSRLLAMAKDDPEIMGLSISFRRDRAAEARDHKGKDGLPAGRVAGLYSVDFVGDPGANPDGLLSAAAGRAPAAQPPTEDPMTRELKKYLVQCGLSADATDAEAQTFLAALKGDQKDVADALAAKPEPEPAAKLAAKPAPAPAATPAPDPDAAAKESLKAERKRVNGIKKLAAKHKLDDDWVERMCDSDRTVEDAAEMAEQLAAHVAKYQPVRGIVAGSGRPGGREVLSCAALMANAEGMTETFLAKHFSADVMTEANKRRRISLKALIATACQMDGRPAPLLDDGPMEWLSAAFSTASLPGILGDSANKSLLAGYEAVPALVPIFFGRRTVTNFREYTEYRMTGDETFDLVAPGGEVHHGELGEEHDHYQAKTYGKMFTLDRTMIVNDDLGAFLQIPQRFGRGAALTREKAGATLIMDNTGSFFVASGHKNLSTGAGSALGAAGLAAAEKLMLEQTNDSKGKNPIFVQPWGLLVPPALKGAGDDLYKLALISTGGSNKYQGLYQPRVWPFLGNTSFHSSASSAYWYLFADPANVAAFLVAYLNGVETPIIEEMPAAANILGTTWRAIFDFGVSQGDYRAAVRSNGA